MTATLSERPCVALRAWTATAALAAGLTAVYYLLPFDGRSWVLGVLLGLAVPVALVPLALHQVKRILAAPAPLAATVRALVVVPSVVVLGFASAYYALEVHRPGEVSGVETKTDALYFAVTVLSTVGFGDVHAAGQAARVVATLHMVVNVAMLGFILQAVTWAARRRGALDGRRLVDDATAPRAAPQRPR